MNFAVRIFIPCSLQRGSSIFSKGCAFRLRRMWTHCWICSWSDDRTRIGFELLRLLRETNRLYFWTTKGLRENQKFKPEVFFRVLEQAGVIGCQNGQRIVVGDFPGSQAAQKDSEARRAHSAYG